MFLKGKTAIVTGSTSGIGRHMPGVRGRGRQYSSSTASVMLGRSSRSGSRKSGQRTPARSTTQATGRNQRDRGHVARCHAESRRTDIIVNNVGIQHVAPIEEFPLDKYDAIIAIKCRRVALSRAVVPT